MLKKINAEMRTASHSVIRSAVDEVFDLYFNEESLKELTTQEINMLSDVLTTRLVKEVSNQVLHRTYKITMN